jgi:hypothetical protein
MFQIREHPAYPYVIRLLLIGIVIILALQVIRMWHTMERGAPGTVDFSAYWSAGQLLRRGENPHDVERLLTIEAGREFSRPLVLGLWNPPWLLIWLFPFLLMDFKTATLAWLGANMTIILISSSLLWIYLNPQPTRPQWHMVWIAGIAFAPALLTLRQGQVSSLSLLGIAAFLYFIKQERDGLAGASLALLTAKPHMVYLVGIVALWWIVTQRRWRALAGCVGMLIISGAILTAIRPAWIADYRAALANPPLYWATPTIGGVLRGFLGIETPLVQYFAPATVGLLVVVYLVWLRPTVVWERDIGPVLLLSVITMAYGWPYDQIVLLVPYLQLITWLRTEETFRSVDRLLISGSLVLHSGTLIALNLLEVDGLYQFWTSWVLAAGFTLAWLRHHQMPAPHFAT